MACVPMFCLEIVEVHSPDRVMRQFGHSQHVSVSPSWGTNHHVHDQRRRLGTEVLEMMDKYFRDWQLRLSWPICLHVEHLRVSVLARTSISFCIRVVLFTPTFRK